MLANLPKFLSEMSRGSCTFNVWSFIARPGDQTLEGMLRLTLWRRMYSKWLFRQSMKIVEYYIEQETKSWRTEMAELTKKKAIEPLNAEEAARIVGLSKQFNEVARLMMAASMSTRAMTYDKRCFALLCKKLDYNSFEMLHYIMGEAKLGE